MMQELDSFARITRSRAAAVGAALLRSRGSGPILLALLLVLLTVAASFAVAADEGPCVIFTKDFPNSQPDYFSVTVNENGQTIYRTAPDDNTPLQFTLPPESAGEIFRLAEKLNWFKDGNLESHRRVANMGKKTLQYQKGAEHYQDVFNHTELPEALALATLFERISQTEQHLLHLQSMMRFDKLGVVKELLQVEMDLDQGRLLGAAQLVPLLEKIRNDRSIANLAQERAVQILGKVQAGKP